MNIEVIDLVECFREQVRKQLESHRGIEATVFMNEGDVVIRFYDRVFPSMHGVTYIINRREIEDCNSLDIFNVLIDQMISIIEDARKKEEMEKRNLEAVRKEAIVAARQLYYSLEYITQLYRAMSTDEINRIMRNARREKFGLY